MKVRKVSADVLDPSKPAAARAPSARTQRRLELERKLERVVRQASGDPASAYRLVLEGDDKPATVRQAFMRVRRRLDAQDVNLFARGDSLIAAKRPQRRGRRASTSSAS